jgi:hypothetical protein
MFALRLPYSCEARAFSVAWLALAVGLAACDPGAPGEGPAEPLGTSSEGLAESVYWHAGNFRYLDERIADLEAFAVALEHPYRLKSLPSEGGYGKATSDRKAKFNDFLKSLFGAIDATMQDGATGDWCGVRAKASLAGYAVERFYDTASGRWLVYGYDRTANGQAYFFINPRAKRNVVIEVPHEGDSLDPGGEDSAATGARLFKALAARALIINKENRCSDLDASTCSGTTKVCWTDGVARAYRESDVAHQDDNTFHELHKCFSDSPSSAHPCGYGFASRFVQVHGMRGSNDGTNWANVGDGSTSSSVAGAVSNTFISHLRAFVDAGDRAGLHSCQASTSSQLLCGETNLQARHTNGSANACGTGTSAASGRFLHLELHATLRDADETDRMSWGDVRDALVRTWPTCEYFDGATDCTMGSRQTQYTRLTCPP